MENAKITTKDSLTLMFNDWYFHVGSLTQVVPAQWTKRLNRGQVASNLLGSVVVQAALLSPTFFPGMFMDLTAGEGSGPRDDGRSAHHPVEFEDGPVRTPGNEFKAYHLPVLARETVDYLVTVVGGTYVDGTTGEGGHARAILEAPLSPSLVIGIDLDPRSLASARNRLADAGAKYRAVAGSYADMVDLVRGEGVSGVDGILLDLGFSSRQVDTGDYGLSFDDGGPLDMRYDPAATLDADLIVNEYEEAEIADILRRYGEERRARAIAGAIVRNRPIGSAGALSRLVGDKVGRRPGSHINPATRTFQALRIAVNDELGNLERGLEAAVEILNPQGRLAVISYHSLEDRIVKSFFLTESAACVCPPGLPMCVCGHTPRLERLNRRVIKPAAHEVESNPRSRSARLRVASRL